MHYFIDGYNFLFRLSKKKLPLEKKRGLLLVTLNEEIGKLGLNATIVFDSKEKYQDAPTRGHLDALEIIYTTRNESADDYILKAIEEATHPQNETVVSSDRELTGRSKQLGAKILSIEEFIAFIMRKKEKKKKLLSPLRAFKDSEKEIERLLKIFEERFKDL
ncbi:MAG TPA: NYN domain-containing protein [Rhabdochlamydiaceae bacterium]|nr:NYN domain-containing protein [Rhabdochlamydiaceae bacterium]